MPFVQVDAPKSGRDNVHCLSLNAAAALHDRCRLAISCITVPMQTRPKRPALF
jgi:hypothetical protein